MCLTCRVPCLRLQEGRRRLPVYKYREEILAAVKDHQVLVLSAETGSGETDAGERDHEKQGRSRR